MSITILDPTDAKEARRRLRARKTRFEECWNGRLVVPPLPNIEHHQIQFLLGAPLHDLIVRPGLGTVTLGSNVSDRATGWKKNYRGPDLLVYLAGNPAIDHDTHWQGGPDFLVEVLSPGERPRAKFKFYASINTREVLLIHRRRTWALELFQLRGSTLVLAGRSDLADPVVLTSGVLPLTFQLVPGSTRPRILTTHPPTGQHWQA